MTSRAPIPPRGFRFAGLACGIKKSGNSDLMLMASDTPATAAGVFTRNIVCAAPVELGRKRVPRADARGVVINSGNANASTGEEGLRDAEWMTAEVAKLLGCEAEQVLACSTGIIGNLLPRPALAEGFAKLAAALGDTADHVEAAARGMMTTDTVPKWAEAAAGAARFVGLGKGAAMIHPDMGTMLAVVATDAALTPEAADRILRAAVDDTFNCITVDGHTSPSDTVLLFANGLADEADEADVTAAVESVCRSLSEQIIRDAEGAEHFVRLEVRGLPTREEAKRIAETVCTDALVKTAITGNDPNWGRITSACGRCGVAFDPLKMELRINGVEVYHGRPAEYDEPALSKSMAAGEVEMELDFHSGDAVIRYCTTDLTREYVRLNSEYTT